MNTRPAGRPRIISFKCLAFGLSALFLCIFHVHAQLPSAGYSIAFTGNDGDSTNATDGNFGEFYTGAPEYDGPEFSYSIPAGDSPIYDTISSEGLVAEMQTGFAYITGSIVPSAFSNVSLTATATQTYAMEIIGPGEGNLSIGLSTVLSGGDVTYFTQAPFYDEEAESDVTVGLYGGVSGENYVNFYDQDDTFDQISENVSLPINQELLVTMQASISLEGTPDSGVNSVTVSGTASADPAFTLSPTEIADGYSIELSPGIGSVPEPSTWASTLTAGIGALLLFCRRR